MNISKKLVLASNSPRRRELLGGLGLDFDVRIINDIDESFPDNLSPSEIAEYISSKKAEAYKPCMADDELIITADTIVVLGNCILGKPNDGDDASRMLKQLSGKTHQVITGVSLMTVESTKTFSVTTDVTFKVLCDDEINYYIENYKPFDKAGAYGIQEWIGYIGVTSLEGSYFNVMGLPVQRIYNELKHYFYNQN